MSYVREILDPHIDDPFKKVSNEGYQQTSYSKEWEKDYKYQ